MKPPVDAPTSTQRRPVHVDAERVERGRRACGRHATRTAPAAAATRDRLRRASTWRAGLERRRAADRARGPRRPLRPLRPGSARARAARARHRGAGARVAVSPPSSSSAVLAAFAGAALAVRLAGVFFAVPLARFAASSADFAIAAFSLRSSAREVGLGREAERAELALHLVAHDARAAPRCGGGSRRRSRRRPRATWSRASWPWCDEIGGERRACERRSSVNCIPASRCASSREIAASALLFVGARA